MISRHCDKLVSRKSRPLETAYLFGHFSHFSSCFLPIDTVACRLPDAPVGTGGLKVML